MELTVMYYEQKSHWLTNQELTCVGRVLWDALF